MNTSLDKMRYNCVFFLETPNRVEEIDDGKRKIAYECSFLF